MRNYAHAPMAIAAADYTVTIAGNAPSFHMQPCGTKGFCVHLVDRICVHLGDRSVEFCVHLVDLHSKSAYI